MSKSPLKVGLECSAYAVIATRIVAMTWVALAQGIDTLHRKTIVLDMSWKRGDVHYGPDFIHLESSCLSNSEAGCYCANNFTTSKEFADYIEAFGNKKVPVSYYVDYDAKGEPSGVVLKSVGEWPADRFNIRERSISSGFRMVRSQSKSGVMHGKTPGDCFPVAAK
jgi:hypothetical protein